MKTEGLLLKKKHCFDPKWNLKLMNKLQEIKAMSSLSNWDCLKLGLGTSLEIVTLQRFTFLLFLEVQKYNANILLR